MTNSTQPEETASCVPLRWERLAWLPILLLAVLIAGLWVLDLRTEYEWPSLQMTLNFVTRTLACLVIAFLAGRSFLAHRLPGVLLMGCGVLIWGASGFIATAIVTLDANLGVTISNIGLWAAALCHLTGVGLSLQSRRTIPETGFRLAFGYALALGFVGLITLATFAGWLPLFFVDGLGGTPVRYVVLGTAFVMLALTAAFLWEKNLRKYSLFNLWYSYALMLIAIGVFGMLLQTSRGSMLNWMTRITQYLSGIYMLIAALSASRTSQVIEIPPPTEEVWRENGFLAGLWQQTTFGWVMRYGVAIVAVAVALGLRQALEVWVGHGLPPYITFYPAMMAVVVLTGFGPGVLSTVLMAMIAAYWILPPFGQLAIASPVDRLGLAIFTGTNLFMCMVAEIYRRNREKAAAYDRESSLRESEARYRSIMDNIQDSYIRADNDGIVIMASPSVAQLYGLESTAEIIGMPALSLYNNPEDRSILLEELKKHGRVKDYECEALRKNGTSIRVSLNVQYHYNGNGEIQGTEAFVRDITERKQVETFRSMGQDILLVLNEDKDQKETIKRVIDIIKSATGVDAVGIRLQDEDDFPYFYQEGFPEDFLLKENSLLARTKDGGICRDECGNICLECTCGLIVTSKTDPSSPLFTKGGSSWTNDSFPFLHVPINDDIRTNPRNECIHQGFASVALIPIRAKGCVVGLLQLNDRRKGRFTLEGIEALEKIAENIGESMLRKQAEDALRESEERFHSMFENHHAVMLVIEPDSGTIVEANAAAARFYGFSNAQLCAMKVQELNLLPPDEIAAERRNAAEDRRNYFVFPHRLANGELRWVEVYSTPWVTCGRTLLFSIIHDITDRKQAEELVLRNQKIFNELIERSPFGTYVVDSQFLIAIMNTASQAGAFRNVQPLIGRDFTEAMHTLWPEEVAVEIIGQFRHTLDTGEPYFSRDFINPRHDADIVEAYEWELHRIALPDGQDGVICYYYNSTKLREAEAAERSSRAKLTAAFASMTEAIFIADADGQLMDFNDEFIRYHRFKDRDECSRTIDDCPKYLAAYFADGTPAPPVQWAMPRALRGEMASNVEYRLLRKETGETWWGSYSFAPIKDIDGRIVGAVVSAREITALKRAEEALRESEQHLRSHVDNSPLAVVEWDKDFIVTRWAGEAEKMFGWCADETLGKPVADLNLIYEPDIPIAQETMAKLTGGNNKVISINRNNTKDGRVIQCTWYNSVLMDDQGKVATVLSLVLDITERKRAEEALEKLNIELENKVMQRTAELREKDQMLLLQSRQAAMGEMIGNISHQWRQPLNILGMQLQQLPLFYDLGQFNKELLEKNVAAAMEVIKHMSKTIDDFRNYFKPDKEKTEFNVHESINTSLLLLEGSLKNPVINVEVVAKDDPIIYGFPNEFTQVILNIMNNARDVFIERNVRNPKVNIKIYNEGMCVIVTVADNAGGIPEEIINKVFDPYFTTKGPQQGTGVGLFMSKSIIEKNMGGRLQVRNIADGAEFRIEV